MSTIFATIGSAARSACSSVLRLSGARLALAAAGALTLAGASVAQAHHRECIDVGVVVAPVCAAPVCAAPVCEHDRIWVPAVYRTACDHVWREPVYRTCCEKVFVPAVFEVREVHHHDRCRDFCVRERILVCPAHYEDRTHEELVCPGHFEDVQRQELVCDGHWEVRDRVVVAEPVHPVVEVFPRFDLRIGR